ncbi:MAG: PHP domain-containing protein [Chloroflexi bacterium]|nr:PHP domain-containing protein [Chloroflexota bacterium]
MDDGATQQAPPMLWADLHIHTVASPCAEIEMLPSLIVGRAAALGLGCIAITDHNTTANIQAVARCASAYGIRVIPGMEVQTREEVHLLCLFDTIEQAFAWQNIVDAALPDMKNRDDVFGAQLVVDENDGFVRLIERMLLIAADISVDQTVLEVNRLGGIVIAAHIDRQAYSIITALGFIPPDMNLAALEVSRATTIAEAKKRYPFVQNWPLITNSDAHRLDEMCRSIPLEHEIASVRKLMFGKQGSYTL